MDDTDPQTTRLTREQTIYTKRTNLLIRGGGVCVSQQLLNLELGCEFFVALTNARTTHADAHFPKQMLLGLVLLVLERKLP